MEEGFQIFSQAIIGWKTNLNLFFFFLYVLKNIDQISYTYTQRKKQTPHLSFPIWLKTHSFQGDTSKVPQSSS